MKAEQQEAITQFTLAEDVYVALPMGLFSSASLTFGDKGLGVYFVFSQDSRLLLVLFALIQTLYYV